MAEKRTLKSWASKQVHKPTDKISNFDKLKAPYILNEYETWGDLYAAVGIDAPVDKEKSKPKTPKDTGRTLNDISSDLDTAQREAGAAYLSLRAYEPGSPEYQAAKTVYDTSNSKIDILKSEIEYYQRKTENEKIDKDIKKKKNELKRTKDLGEDTTQIDKDLNEFDAKKKENEKVITDLKPKVTQGEKSKTSTQAASAAALGLPTSSLSRPATAVEKIAKEASDAKGQVTPKVPGAPKGKETPKLTDTQQREEALGLAGGADFALPETIFNNVPSLKLILERYVAEDWTADKLRKAIRDDVWYRQNSGAIKQRYVQLFNYRDLVNTGQAQGTTQYEQDIVKLERQIADKARAIGSGIASDPVALRKAAENMYITNVGIDDAMTTDFIAAAIRPIGSTIAGQPTSGYSGQALKDYQAIQDVARSNGFSVKDIIPGGQTEQQVLQGIATGKIDPNRLAQDARKLAAQGQPQYVRDLLGQGYNLDQVYAPYRQTMANLLELNADEIDLNDSALRSAITEKGDMNVYDFKRTLKADKRWQYTENAKEEVSAAALSVLRDFGFQG